MTVSRRKNPEEQAKLVVAPGLQSLQLSREGNERSVSYGNWSYEINGLNDNIARYYDFGIMKY